MSVHQVKWVATRRAPLERDISAGFGYFGFGDDRLVGLGLDWGRPNGDLIDAATDDQYTVEAYARLQVLPRLAITPDIQLIKNPAWNPPHDLIWVAGLHARLSF
jgi:porin